MANVRLFRHGNVHDAALELEQMLKEHGVVVQPGSSLERMTLSAWEIIERTRVEANRNDGTDIRPLFGDMCALTELVEQLLAVRDHPSFSQLVPHFQLLNRAEAAQNRSSAGQDSNKVFELLAACYAMRMSGVVSVDHPERSRGDNPDVLLEFPRGQMFGIACKVLNSRHPQAFLHRLEEGIDQIERSEADRGVVFLSLKNLLDYDRFWPRVDGPGGTAYTALSDPNDPLKMLGDEVNRIRDGLVDHVNGDLAPIRAFFDGRKSLPVALLYAHVMCAIKEEHRVVPSSVKFPAAITMGPVRAPFASFLERLTAIMARGATADA